MLDVRFQVPSSKFQSLDVSHQQQRSAMSSQYVIVSYSSGTNRDKLYMANWNHQQPMTASSYQLRPMEPASTCVTILDQLEPTTSSEAIRGQLVPTGPSWALKCWMSPRLDRKSKTEITYSMESHIIPSWSIDLWDLNKSENSYERAVIFDTQQHTETPPKITYSA